MNTESLNLSEMRRSGMCGHGQHLAKLKRTDQVHCSTTTVKHRECGL